MYHDQRLELRLGTRDLLVLDEKRQGLSRSKYLRWLIHNGPKPVTPRSIGGHPHPEPHPDPLEPYEPPIPSPIEPPVPPPNPIETRSIQVGDPFRD